MTETIQIGNLSIQVTRKDIKNVHLSVHPPDGKVTLAAPQSTRLEVARAYAISKLRWIRAQQSKLKNQARETPRQYIERESHYLWGRRYLMTLRETSGRAGVTLDHKRLTLNLRPGSGKVTRERLVHEWHKRQLRKVLPALIAKWEKKLNVHVNRYFLQRMKTKWGSCNPKSGHIRLNTELVKKPKDLLEYVLVHEMAHLIEPTHNERFFEILTRHYSGWKEAREELNELPVRVESWEK